VIELKWILSFLLWFYVTVQVIIGLKMCTSKTSVNPVTFLN